MGEGKGKYNNYLNDNFATCVRCGGKQPTCRRIAEVEEGIPSTTTGKVAISAEEASVQAAMMVN